MAVILVFLCACFALGNAANLTYMVDLTYPYDECVDVNFPTIKKFDRQIVSKGYDKNGNWFYIENFCIGSHAGTHIDAPAHYSENGRTVDQIPLPDLFRKLALVNVCEQAKWDRDYQVQVDDILEWERQTECSVNGRVVMIHSCWGHKYRNQEDYLGNCNNNTKELHYPGIHLRTAKWLVNNRKIPGVGIDTVSVDHGPGVNAGNPVHRLLLCAGLYLLENVANLHLVKVCPAADLYVMPMKLAGASGAPARIFAEFKAS